MTRERLEDIPAIPMPVTGKWFVISYMIGATATFFVSSLPVGTGIVAGLTAAAVANIAVTVRDERRGRVLY